MGPGEADLGRRKGGLPPIAANEPSVVGGAHVHVRASRGPLAQELGKADLEANVGGELEALGVHEDRARSALEHEEARRHEALHEGVKAVEERVLGLEGDVLGDGHALDLVVASHDLGGMVFVRSGELVIAVVRVLELVLEVEVHGPHEERRLGHGGEAQELTLDARVAGHVVDDPGLRAADQLAVARALSQAQPAAQVGARAQEVGRVAGLLSSAKVFDPVAEELGVSLPPRAPAIVGRTLAPWPVVRERPEPHRLAPEDPVDLLGPEAQERALGQVEVVVGRRHTRARVLERLRQVGLDQDQARTRPRLLHGLADLPAAKGAVDEGEHDRHHRQGHDPAQAQEVRLAQLVLLAAALVEQEPGLGQRPVDPQDQGAQPVDARQVGDLGQGQLRVLGVPPKEPREGHEGEVAPHALEGRAQEGEAQDQGRPGPAADPEGQTDQRDPVAALEEGRRQPPGGRGHGDPAQAGDVVEDRRRVGHERRDLRALEGGRDQERNQRHVG